MRRPFLNLLRKLLMLWVRPKVVPQESESLGLDPKRPICYVLESYGLSSLLILEQVCLNQGLPSPLQPARANLLGENRAYIVLNRKRGWLLRRRVRRTHSPSLRLAVEAAYGDVPLDAQLVPVSIFVGRSPDKEHGAFKILFSERWTIGGRIRRLVSTLIHGRNTLVQLSEPLSVSEAAEGLEAGRALRKVSRVLRVHFRRLRTAVIGPDLSHRRTVMATVMRSRAVREAIEGQARRGEKSIRQLEDEARRYADEIAADYSASVIRFFWRLLTWFWNRIYSGVSVNHLEALREIAPGHEIVYLPCHRSHIDYMLLSYLLYDNGLMIPHIAAGKNLNLPLIHHLMRGAGAFFIRRSFRANVLYSVVFHEYVSALLSKGIPIEFYIEGTRSRTGRLLPPRPGMLAMTVRSYLRNPHRPVLYQPVYVGYEKLVEGSSYVSELSGQPKKKESLLGLLRAVRVLRNRYGRAHVSFGEPIALDDLLNQHNPDWRDQDLEDDRPPWLPNVVDDLAARVMVGINEAADVNPVNLLALALLPTPKQTLAEEDLTAQLELLQMLLREGPVSARVTVTDKTPADIIRYGESLKLIERTAHPQGNIVRVAPSESVLLTYYRNNSLHLYAIAAWCACCFLNNARFSRRAIKRLGVTILPLLRTELFLPHDAEAFQTATDETLDLLMRRGYLKPHMDDDQLQRAAGGSSEAMQLKLLGKCIIQSLERYYITTALLARSGSGTLEPQELESLSHTTAERLSLIYGFHAPEFFDPKLFKNLVVVLRDQGVIWKGDDGKLAFDERLEQFIQEAKLILSKDIRHSILEVSPRDVHSSSEAA